MSPKYFCTSEPTKKKKGLDNFKILQIHGVSRNVCYYLHLDSERLLQVGYIEISEHTETPEHTGNYRNTL